MILHWPQITELFLMLFCLANTLIKDGQPKTGKESFIAALIGISLLAWILFHGGFWAGGVCQ